MLIHKNNFRCYTVMAFMLCLGLLIACDNPAGNNNNNNNNTESGTWVEFTNLESSPVTIYSDPGRQTVFAEVAANGKKKAAAAPNPVGTPFYPTFNLDLFNIPGISVPYNGPAFIAPISADTVNQVSIPKLESVETNSAYIKLTNNSSFSLAFRQGNVEKSPLGGGSIVIASGQSAAYEITPGQSSGYSVMRNTTVPVAFPADLTEFRRGIIYEFSYNGANLTLASVKSVMPTIYPVFVPGNGLAAKLAWLRINAESNHFYDIELNADENIVPQNLSYSGKNGIIIAMSGSTTMRTINLSANGSLFTINSGVTLILSNNIILNGKSGNNASLVNINSGGTLVMNAGTKITGNTTITSSGVGVYISSSGTFIMNGGEISDNANDRSSNATGGGVYNRGTFTMNDGKISRNTAAYNGGGVCVYDGTFTMNGGEISNNTVYRGGGVYVYGGNTFFHMSGGVIYGANAAEGLQNTATIGASLNLTSSPTAQYGMFNGDTFYKSGNLTTTDTTIRIVNGNLLTE